MFEKLWRHSRWQPYAIRTVEGHHYRRFALRKMDARSAYESNCDGLRPVPGRAQPAPLGLNDGRGIMFVSHTGSVYPSPYLPLRCGRFPDQSIVDIYQRSSTFRELRDWNLLTGKCGDCEFRSICGGSRARAYAVHRDHLAEEPDCAYIPRSRRLAVAC